MEHFGVQRQTSRPGGKWNQQGCEQPRWHHTLFTFPQVSPCIFFLLWRQYSCRLVWWSIRQVIFKTSSYLERSGRKEGYKGVWLSRLHAHQAQANPGFVSSARKNKHGFSTWEVGQEDQESSWFAVVMWEAWGQPGLHVESLWTGQNCCADQTQAPRENT